MKLGKLTVSNNGIISNGKEYLYCDCDCGNKHFLVLKDDIDNKKVTSCGCEQFKLLKNYVDPKDIKPARYKHGDSLRSSKYYNLHSIWNGMRRRCNCTADKSYKDYGAAGIKVCDEWDNLNNGYENFKEWSLKHGYEKGKTIDRINNSKGYSPDNVRWADAIVQANNKTNNTVIEYYGIKHTLAEWCRIFEINYDAVVGRHAKNPDKCSYQLAIDIERSRPRSRYTTSQYIEDHKNDKIISPIIIVDEKKAHDENIIIYGGKQYGKV